MHRRRRILILGAAGRDFHNFNTAFRDDPACEVIAFTATQIPGISGRRYPPQLAGPLYPDGIPIEEEAQLEQLIQRLQIDEVVFAYSDIAHVEVMHLASRVLAAGADFCLLGPRRTMLAAQKPVIAVSAVRTGAGKSQISRWISRRLVEHGLRVSVLRHPMPYGQLERQAVQRFATVEDLDRAQCTLEEREEYEPHLVAGNTVFAGVDYARILEAAQREADILLWDGGNNDFPFIRPDLHIVLVDPMRPGHETSWHPGEAVLRMADLVIVAKSGSATAEALEQVEASALALAPVAPRLRVDSAIRLDPDVCLAGKRVIVVEDGPTLTHGGMSHGAGWVAAQAAGAIDIVDPRSCARGMIVDVFARFPHIGPVLPATGYSDQERRDLAATIRAAGADFVVAGTPIDLGRALCLDTPVLRARYEHREVPGNEIWPAIQAFLDRLVLADD
jgi:predicted GTPase